MSEGPAKTESAAAEGITGRDRQRLLDDWFRQYFVELVRLLERQLADPDEASDLAQAAFARLAARVDRLGAITHPRAFLYRIARNVLVDRSRHRMTARVREQQAVTLGALTDGVEPCTPEDATLGREALGELERIVRALPDKRRRIFILSRVHGLSADEIADREGMSKRAVRGHIERAMADIRALMRDSLRPRSRNQGER